MPAQIFKRRLLILLALCCTSLALFTSVQNSRDYDWTYDEPFHLSWNQRFLNSNETERESAYNYISTTPIVTLNILLAEKLKDCQLLKPASKLFRTRILTTCWLAVLLFTVLLVARALGGTDAALIAVSLTALEPTIVAHSSLATVDVPFAASVLLFTYSLLRFSESQSFIDGVLTGVYLGLCLSVKFTAALLIPFFFLIPLILNGKAIFNRRNILIVVSAALAATLVVNIAYAFTQPCLPFSTFRFYSGFFQSLQESAPWLVLPLPKDFITGFDHLLAAGKRKEWNVVMWGNWYGNGVWHYFVTLFFFKTPAAALLFFSAALYRLNFIKTVLSDRKHICIFLLSGFLFLYFSFFVRAQVGYRYVLMCLPLFLILLGISLNSLLSSKKALGLLLLGFVFLLTELFPYRDNLISFTNVFLQPKKSAYKILADSNIDWGHKRYHVRDKLPELGVSYRHYDPLHLLPGTNVISINHLTGVFWNFERFKWLRNHKEPAAHIHHSALVYEITEADFTSYLHSERSATKLHSPPSQLKGLVPFPRSFDMELKREQATLLVFAEAATLIRFYAQKSAIEVGQPKDETCANVQRMEQGQELWFSLQEQAAYSFCISDGNATLSSVLISAKGKLKYLDAIRYENLNRGAE